MAGAVLASVVLGIFGWSLVASLQPTAQATGVAQLSDEAAVTAPTPSGTPEPDATAGGDSGPLAGVDPAGGIGEAGSPLPSPANPVASNAGGGVTIKVTWQGQQEDGGPLVFLVSMDTHSVALDGYDLSTMAVLRSDQGSEVAPLSWEAPPGGHHREGLLTFPATDETGSPVVGPGIRVVELVIRGLARVPERVLSWEVS